ncbi:MAG: hypothetical protein V3S42_00570 [Candidatus Neomarinimicrobiota bacterium]
MKKSIQLILSIILFIGITSGLLASDRSVIKIGSDVHIDKDMRVEDAVAIGGSVYIDGILDGDAVAIGGTIHLGEEAIIHGDAVTVGGDIHQAEGSMIYGDIVDVGAFDFENIFEGKNFFGGHRSISRGLKFIPLIGLIALALLIAVLIPTELGTVTNNIKNEPIIMFLYGLLGIVLIVPLAIMLAISIIGIALIPIEILAVFLASLIGYLAVAIIIGKRVLRAFKKDNPAVILSAILGVLILWFIGLIPIFGCIVKAIAYIVGFGAVIMAVARRNKKMEEIVIEPESTKSIKAKKAE